MMEPWMLAAMIVAGMILCAAAVAAFLLIRYMTRQRD